MSHMEKAASLARSVLGSTSPNPAVGAVVVKDGVEVGWGATRPPGKSHAEIGALQQAGPASRGSTLYTTLEPCCIHGRTPPCTGAIIEAGVAEVRVAAIDPNPKVSGRGCEELRSAGVRVVIQREPENIDELYEAFSKHVNTGTPFVKAKFAMSLDGKIATRTGHSKWVTGTESRRMVQDMRRQCDAVLVGVNTVLADDPLLTVRDSSGNPSPRQPRRVVADSRCRTSPDAQILRQPGETLIACADTADAGKVQDLEKAGANVLRVRTQHDGRLDLGELLDELGRGGVVSLLVEGGGSVLGAMFDRGMVDKVYAFIAPVIVGGEGAPSPVEGRGAATMDAAWRLNRSRLEPIGPDWLIIGYPAAGS